MPLPAPPLTLHCFVWCPLDVDKSVGNPPAHCELSPGIALCPLREDTSCTTTQAFSALPCQSCLGPGAGPTILLMEQHMTKATCIFKETERVPGRRNDVSELLKLIDDVQDIANLMNVGVGRC